MQITGHKTEAVYRRYHIVSEADIRRAGERLGQYLEAKGAEKTVSVQSGVQSKAGVVHLT